MFPDNTITGPGYSVQVPPGFTFAGGVPSMGVYRLMPPDASQFEIDAMLQIRPVQGFELPQLMQNLLTFDNPMVAQMNANNLGLTQVLGVMPVREVPMPQGQMSIREFDAMNPLGMQLRVMVMVMRGPQSAVEVVVMMNLFRWTEFAGPCLAFVGQIQLQGGAPQQPSQLQAVVDQHQKDQIEYQLVSPDHAPIPLTALPTCVGGTLIIHVDTLIQTGNINGTGIAVGTHSLATVTQDAAPAQ